MRKIFSFKKNKGFTMLEMTIATFILVTAIIGVYSTFSHITITTSIILSRLTAAYLAQEGIEIIRNMRDTNWLYNLAWDENIIDICSLGCEADYTTEAVYVDGTFFLREYAGVPLAVDVGGFYNYSSGSPTKFKRRITVTKVTPTADDDVLWVSVLIEWEDRGKSYNFTAEENLYDWF